ncbi:phosphoribosyltransferase [Winogradskyella thalassocola]|uniref:Predicted phosphoribosyltransferase n=1 Tax=Winogradskyella thalassocola TaxID=262004 RepID=A0A1G8JIA8_9FLAO|nr:phosphoribosyltransferase family protein [Winogradskyella thalassocola]SDI30945.1 Predicted phosphoribosyltransferase [Winogradskyella thalassocola]
MVFKDRIEAAYLLADQLETYKEKNALILAIPRGGVPMGYILAKQLHLPLEVVLSKKIGHPLHKEFAIGAVTLKSLVLSEAAKEVSKNYIEEETKKNRTLLSKRYQDYYGNKKPQELKDKILIIVDDGIATGNTIISTIEMLHDEQPKKIVVAIPVSSKSALQKLKNTPFINEVICLSIPENFRAVGQFYKNFDQVDDTEVKTYLNKKTTS